MLAWEDECSSGKPKPLTLMWGGMHLFILGIEAPRLSGCRMVIVRIPLVHSRFPMSMRGADGEFALLE